MGETNRDREKEGKKKREREKESEIIERGQTVDLYDKTTILGCR